MTKDEILARLKLVDDRGKVLWKKYPILTLVILWVGLVLGIITGFGLDRLF